MKHTMLALSLVSAALLTIAGAAGTFAASTSPLQTAAMMTSSRGAQVGFVNEKGSAVYVYDLDLGTPGTSQCNDACAARWPAISPPSGALSAPWGTIVRSDGTKQLTYAGRPLYGYADDHDAKQAKGDLARGGTWHLAQPQGVSAPTPTSSYGADLLWASCLSICADSRPYTRRALSS